MSRRVYQLLDRSERIFTSKRDKQRDELWKHVSRHPLVDGKSEEEQGPEFDRCRVIGFLVIK